MSCHYPSCYLGSHSCPFEDECDKIAKEKTEHILTMARLELEEAKLRVELLKKKVCG